MRRVFQWLPFWGRFEEREQQLLSLFLVITGVSRLLYMVRSVPAMATGPYIEDSFYVLNVARHLAAGQGFTVDGIHPTNGIQPLITLLYTPFFCLAGSDEWLGVRLTFLLGAAVEITSVYLAAVLLKTLLRGASPKVLHWYESPSVVIAGLWCGAYALLWNNNNGLETGMYAMFILASILLYAILIQREATVARDWILFGVLLGMLVLARVDGAILVASYAVFHSLRHRWQGLRESFLFGTAALLTSAWWWVYNVSTFGHLMPQSGQAEALHGMLRRNLRTLVVELGEIVSMQFVGSLEDRSLILIFGFCVAVIAILAIVLRSTGVVGHLKDRYHLEALFPLLLGGCVLAVYYTAFFSAPWFLGRYLHPLRILYFLLAAIAFPLVARRFAERSPRVRRLAAALLALLILFNAGLYVRRAFLAETEYFYEVGLWAQQHSSDVIGMEQSGLTGFMAPNVVNLDGKVNFDALRALHQGQRGEYIRDMHFAYLIDWRPIVEPMVREAARAGVTYSLTDSMDLFHFYRRQP